VKIAIVADIHANYDARRTFPEPGRLSPLAAGAVFTPSAIAFFAASLVGPRLAGAIGRKALLLGVIIFWTAMVLAIGAGAAFAIGVLSLWLPRQGQSR
jgi:MFS family permease